MSDYSDEWPPRAKGPIWKTPRGARKVAQVADRKKVQTKERNHKLEAKKRDGSRCRWPLCGCGKLGFRIEVSHDRHKGSGGNPTGDRSTPDLLITYCFARHQDNPVSRHKGTLRSRYLTPAKCNGPLAFDIDADMVPRILGGSWTTWADRELLAAVHKAEEHRDGDGKAWLEVARERKVQQLELPLLWQTTLLSKLAEMTI